jgi:hypothetical protein
LKTDPRVRSQTQKSADKAISEMLQHNRGLKPKWTPPKTKIKVKKNKLKIKASVDIDMLKFFGIIILCVSAVSLAYYSLHVNFIEPPQQRIIEGID